MEQAKKLAEEYVNDGLEYLKKGDVGAAADAFHAAGAVLQEPLLCWSNDIAPLQSHNRR